MPKTLTTAIVNAILALATSLGLDVVAEGVEQTDQEEFLRKQGCQLAQGYYYGRPMPEEEMLRLLQEKYSLSNDLSDTYAA